MMPGPEIERGIPIPLPNRERFGTKAAQLRDMQVGDSKFFPAATPAERGNWQSSAASLAKTEGWVITTRTVMKDGKIGLRIWRAA